MKHFDIQQLFENKTIGSFKLVFDDEGKVIKSKHADGFMVIKPRGSKTLTRHFNVMSDNQLPNGHVIKDKIEEHFSRIRNVRILQVHCQL